MSKFYISGFSDEISQSLDEQIEAVKKLEMKYIEIRGVDGKNVSELTLEEAKAAKAKLDAAGLKVSSVGSPIGKQSIKDDFAPHLALFRHVLELAKIFEAPYIRMFTFYVDKEELDSYRDEVIARWQAFINAAEGYDVKLCIENEKDLYGEMADRCLDILEALDSDKVGFIFDPANFVQAGQITYPEAFELLGSWITYMHVKDARLSDGKVVPAGYGDGRVPEILAALDRREGFSCFLSLEPHLGFFKGMEALEKNMDIASMPSGSEGLFCIAHRALTDILEKL